VDKLAGRKRGLADTHARRKRWKLLLVGRGLVDNPAGRKRGLADTHAKRKR